MEVDACPHKYKHEEFLVNKFLERDVSFIQEIFQSKHGPIHRTPRIMIQVVRHLKKNSSPLIMIHGIPTSFFKNTKYLLILYITIINEKFLHVHIRIVLCQCIGTVFAQRNQHL